MYKVVRDGKIKSDVSYDILDAMNKVSKVKSVSSAKKLFGIGDEKAKKMMRGEKLSRKLRIFPTKTFNIIQIFYKRDDISRVSPNA